MGMPHHGFRTSVPELWVCINKVDLSRQSLHSMAQRSRLREFEYPIWKAVAHEHTQQILEAQKQIHYYDARIKELDRLQDFEKRLADLEAAKRSLTPPPPPEREQGACLPSKSS